MLKIRLARSGSRNNAFYHIVVIDSRKAQSGKPVQRVGYFNPVARGQDPRLQIDLQAINEWVSKGALVSQRVASLVKEAAVGAGAGFSAA